MYPSKPNIPFLCKYLRLILLVPALEINLLHQNQTSDQLPFLSGKKKIRIPSLKPFEYKIRNSVWKNSCFSLWQWCVAIYCPYSFMQQNPIWCWLKIMRIAFCSIQGFGRHHVWWNLLQPWQRNTSTEGKNSQCLHMLSGLQHPVLRNGCCFWAEQELGRLLIHLSSSI